MFISKSELWSLKETIKHLERRLDNERDARYRLEGQLELLCSHFNIEIVCKPSKWEIQVRTK